MELSFRGLRETCGFPKNLAPRLRRTCHVLPQTLRGAAGRRPGWHGPAQEDSPPALPRFLLNHPPSRERPLLFTPPFQSERSSAAVGPLRKENWGADGTNAEKMPSQPAQTTGAKLRPGRGCSGREDAAVLGPATKGDAEPGTPAAPPRTHLGGAARLRAGEDRGVATENRSKAAAKTLKTAGPEQRKQTKSMPAQAPHQRAPRQPPPRQQPRRALRPGGPRGVPEGRLTCPRRRRPRGPARGAQGPPHAPGCRPPLRTRVLPSVPRPRDPASEPPLPGTPLLPAPTGRLARVRTDSSAARGTLHVAARPSSPPLCGERRQGDAGLPRSAGGRDTGPMSRLEGRRPRCACQPSVAPAPDAHRKARTPRRPAA